MIDILNRTSWPEARLLEIVRFGLVTALDEPVVVTVEHCHHWCRNQFQAEYQAPRPGQPHQIKVTPGRLFLKAESYPFLRRIQWRWPSAWLKEWSEVVLWLASHEAKHLFDQRTYRHDIPFTYWEEELYCERHAQTRLQEWRRVNNPRLKPGVVY